MMTLGTIRAYIWRATTDIAFHYKANGRKRILKCPQAVQGLKLVPPADGERE
jgi:hypothetical protein